MPLNRTFHELWLFVVRQWWIENTSGRLLEQNNGHGSGKFRSIVSISDETNSEQVQVHELAHILRI